MARAELEASVTKAAMGAADFQAKPYRLETLIERIARFAPKSDDDASGASPAGTCESPSGPSGTGVPPPG